MEPAYSDGGLLQRLCVRGKCKGIYQFAPKSLLFTELIDLIFPTLLVIFYSQLGDVKLEPGQSWTATQLLSTS